MGRSSKLYSNHLLLPILSCLCAALCIGCSGGLTNGVSLAVGNPVIPQGSSTSITATMSGANGAAGFTWALAGPGSLSGVTKTSVTYNAPPTVSAETVATVTATSVASPSQMGSTKITVEPPPSITTTSLPAASLGVSYTATINAAGGIPPFSWSIASGSLTTGLTLGASTTRSVTISGMAQMLANSIFTIRITDSTGTSATQALTIVVGASNASLLTGNYAFQFSGFNTSSNPVKIAGSFTADGNGNLTAGVEDANAIGGAPKNQSFTGTYTLGAGNRGVLTFSSLPGSPAYAFALNLTGTHGSLIEFDSTGTRGSGTLAQRSLSTCTSSAFSGNYAFGLTGQEIAVAGVSGAGPAMVAGSFTASPPSGGATQGSIGPGELDASSPVRVTMQDQTVTGTFQATAQPTHCLMNLASSLPAMNFSVYPVSTSQAFLVQVDTVNSTTPVLMAGTIEKQTGFPFSTASGSTFTALSVGVLSGLFPSGSNFVPDVAVVSIAGTGSSNFTIAGTENRAGAITNVPPTTSTFINADQFGRVATLAGTQFLPVFYMISQNTAFCLGEQISSGLPNPFFGIVHPQGPFDAATIASFFAAGTLAPTTAALPNISGSFQFTANSGANPTAGTISGLQDQSTPLGDTAGQTVVGTYTVASSALGTGTITLTQPAALTAAFVIVSPSQIAMITTTTGGTNPVALVFQQ